MNRSMVSLAVLLAFYGCGCAVQRPAEGSSSQSSGQVAPSPISPSAEYLQSIESSIVARWKELDHPSPDESSKGELVLIFRLHKDGTVSHVQVIHNTANERLAVVCQQALQDVAPFARWPPGFASPHGWDYRELTYRFRYTQFKP